MGGSEYNLAKLQRQQKGTHMQSQSNKHAESTDIYMQFVM